MLPSGPRTFAVCDLIKPIPKRIHLSTTRKWLVIAGSLLLMLIFIAVVIRHNGKVIKYFRSATVAAAVVTPDVKPLPSRAFGRLRAVHYFADVHPVQFWNSFELADVERDFSQIRADGFNSIVLILPWAEFQPSLEDGKHDERMFDRLSLLMAAAEKLQLGVVLRVSYFWTFRPGAEREIHSRVHGLFHDDRIRGAWLGHLAEIYRRVGQHPAFRLAFLSWEDLYPMEIASASAVLRDEKILREYRKYLARTSGLDAVSALYGQRFANWESVPFPNRKSAAYAKVFDYWDDALLNRLFTPANQRFPNLSFEVRSDSDPIWGKDDKMIWKNHSATYALPGTNTLTTYYATAWGMKNEGDLASAEETLKQFDRFVDHIKEKDPRHHLFIDQFLFY